MGHFSKKQVEKHAKAVQLDVTHGESFDFYIKNVFREYKKYLLSKVTVSGIFWILYALILFFAAVDIAKFLR